MDVHAHQPGEELADFTESELLSLIEAGTAGAYSEIYRRYRDDAVARASSSLPDAKARQVTDDAFLSVLRSLLNRSSDTAEGLRSMVDTEIDVHLANLTSTERTSASGSDAEAPEAALVSQALSNLPDNWQRILWLREVERLSPEAIAEQLNIKASTVDRLTGRARHGLQDEWQQVRPRDSKATADHRTALIPALLTSPIVIERLSSTLAQAIPEPGPAVAEMTAVEEPTGAEPDTETTMAEGTDVASGSAGANDDDTATAVLPAPVPAGAVTGIDNAPALKPAAGAEDNSATESAAEADSAPESIPAATGSSAADDSAEASDASTEPANAAAGAASISAGAAGAAADDTNTVEPVSLAAFDAQSAAAQTSTLTPEATRFSMPKPVLIPVVAACVGLLGTLVGVAIVPQHDEQTGLRPGNASSAVSPADSSSKKHDKNSSSQSPDDTYSDKADQESGPENSKASDSDRDEDEKSPRTPGHDGSRADDSPSTEDDPGDTGDTGDSNDRPSADEPDEPSPSDSDKPAPESPSEPTPPSSDDPETPSDPPPSDEPSDEPSEEPSEEPSDEPSDEPSEEPSDESPEEPSEEPSDESPEEPSAPGSETPAP
ncbi:sigma-70 family RNA polymerase sigma factor [Brevibacterium sp. RIT 803]|uniref:sigma-70 family RNA polymerase sigma factor n=1 Tax=Brevibacterium sp. RIT 803 TaxID=2810210 RepID=UPI00194F501E|nr:sigma-70 family RNA polymerase sigma factor [Brevibacterium sp. RIT 803]MBM6591524.1 PT domain-containing protein [Brevibacterium sp. RIT 803]